MMVAICNVPICFRKIVLQWVLHIIVFSQGNAPLLIWCSLFFSHGLPYGNINTSKMLQSFVIAKMAPYKRINALLKVQFLWNIAWSLSKNKYCRPTTRLCYDFLRSVSRNVPRGDALKITVFLCHWFQVWRVYAQWN